MRAIHLPKQRAAGLFRVGHRTEAPYPVTIEPEGEELPDRLRKSYYEPGSPGFASLGAAAAAALGGKTEGRVVKNQLVAETPAEFRAVLVKAFNDGYVKGVVYNLVAFGKAVSQGGQVRTESLVE